MSQKIKKAIALDYEQTQGAPKVLANARGEGAKKIISLAKDLKIPIKEDENLAELLSKLDLGEEIPPNMYKAVAEVFAFIYKYANEK